MKKLVSITTLLVVFLSITAFGQGWTYVGPFPDDASFTGNSGGHGIAVDPDGKVWVQIFGVTDTLIGGGDTALVRQIFVFNPDGTPAPFSGFSTITVDGVTDTLFNSSRGLGADQDGHILITSFDVVYRVNYQTGEGMDKAQPFPGVTLIASAVADNGNVFNGPVIPGNPIFEMTPDLSSVLGNVVDLSVGFSRTIAVSGDGNTVYWPGYTNLYIHVYQRPDEFSAFDSVGTIMNGVQCEAIGWHPTDGNLWLSGGSYLTPPDPASPWAANTWYAYDVNTQLVVDSLNWVFTNAPTFTDSANQRPRGIAFSPDGVYAYVTCFGASNYPVVQKFLNPNVGVQPDPNVVVTNYTLAQNYPNPFNPTTDIKFTVAKEGFVTLKVYDLLGKEVATLVNQQMTTGGYKADFDASNLASGTYIYTLSVNGVSISKKMMLLK